MRKINSKGITLISLVITIAVLLILASIATYSGIDVIRQSKLNKFTAEMKVMQTQVNDLYQKYTDGRSVTIGGSTYTGDDILNKIGQDLPSNADSVFTSEKSGITEKEGYRYYNQDTIKGLNIDGVEGEFYVNVKNRSVISTEGLEYEGTTYYTGTNHETELTTEGLDTYNEGLAEYLTTNIGAPEAFYEGEAYFAVPIEHFGGTQDSDDTGAYGVVRNHSYVLNVTQISGLGEGIYDPGEEIIPNPGKKRYYVAATLNVLSWKTVSQDVSFGN